MRRVSAFLSGSSRPMFLLVFVSALFLRALPEFLSGVYPVGFDSLAGYVPAILALPNNSPMKLFGWAYSPLAIYLLWFIRLLTGVDPYFLLKVAGPVFYGCFSVSFCYMLSHGLGWSNRKSLFVSLLLFLQPAILRMGWDQLREELALMLFFVLLGVTKLDLIEGAKSKPIWVLALSVLIVFSDQLVAILFFVVAIAQLFNAIIKGKGRFWGASATVLPSAAVFIWQLYMSYGPGTQFSEHFAPINLPSGTSNFVFTNYFVGDPRFLGGDYWKVLGYVGCLAIYAVILLVPFAIKGFFKDRVFMPILVWLAIASFSIVIYPWYALSQYSWWILLLPIPLTVYIGENLDRLHIFDVGKLNKRKKAFWVALCLLGVIAVGYATSTIKLGYPYAYTYMPAGMVESSVPFEDIQNITAALTWTNENVPRNSTIIVEQKIQGFAYIELRPDIQIRVSTPLLTLNQVLRLINSAPNCTYAVWYNSDIGQGTFFGSKLMEFGDISVFEIQK